MPLPEAGFYPGVGLRSEGEEVRFLADVMWDSHDDVSMVIDSVEEEWARLIDIRLNGQVQKAVLARYNMYCIDTLITYIYWSRS